MQSINHVMIMGNLGADPELFHGKTGTPFCRFRVATNFVKRLENGERLETTNWHRVKVFGKTAEHCSTYLRKGSVAVIDGYIQNQSYKKSDGTDGYSSEIIGQHVSFVNSPRHLGPRESANGFAADGASGDSASANGSLGRDKRETRSFDARMADAMDLATSVIAADKDASRVRTAGAATATARPTDGLPNAAPRARKQRSALEEVPF